MLLVQGGLPARSAALNLSNVCVHRLTVEAALSDDPELIVHACALDPLSSAVLTLREIWDMAGDMLKAQRAWLQQYEGKRIQPTPTISAPQYVKRAEVPVDPPLVIAQRFGKVTA